MASPHPTGPGPSSCYQQHPTQPPTSYNSSSYHSHSPVPAPQHFPYNQYAVQPHLSAHQNLHHQYPAPPRRAAYSYSYASRAGPSYSPYPHPHPQHQQHPYSNSSAPKYPIHQAYSSPYPHPPSAGPYSPHTPWHQPQLAQPQAQVLSPLPAQLTMTLHPDVGPQTDLGKVQMQPYTTNTHDSVSDHSATAALSEPEPGQPQCSPSPVHQSRHSISELSISPSSPKHSPVHLTLFTSPAPSFPSSLDVGSVPTITTELPGSSVWAIWSRRPRDPSQAPGIIFSPRARPPRLIVEQALELPTPPASPQISASALPDASSSLISEPSLSEQVDLSVPSILVQPRSIPSSSAATETTNTPIPGSPVSTSNTSVSLVGTPPRDTKSNAVLEPAATEEIEEENPDAQKAARAQNQPLTSAKPAPKSWASLLSGGSSSSTGGRVKNSLPTSSVVGVSIPASALSESDAVAAEVGNKADLLKLLSGGHPASSNSILGGSYASAIVSVPVSVSSAPPLIRPRGLINTGNMCFANSVLQVLVYCPPFHRLFAELGRLLGDSGAASVLSNAAARTSLSGAAAETVDKPATMVDATVRFLREFVQDIKPSQDERGASGNGERGIKGKDRDLGTSEDDWDGESFIPTYVYDAVKSHKRFDHMRAGQQEDAEEFFGFYLDTLEEELLAIINTLSPTTRQTQGKTPQPVEEKEETAPAEDDGWMEVGKRNKTVVTRTIKTTESPITRLFSGKFRSTLKAPGQKDSVTIEDWRSLRLDIQREQIHSIQDALNYISHPQSVQMTHSSRPGVAVEASQQVLIDALPPILVLHLKRFCYDISVGGVVKVGKHVTFGPELEVRSDVMAPTARRSHIIRYKLFGVVYHHGLSASGGHYTLDVLHPNRYPNVANTKPREAWVRIDDELVSDVRSEDVFGPPPDESRCAYLLFYRRIGVGK